LAVKCAPASSGKERIRGARQPMTTQIRIFRFNEFVLDLNTGSGNLSEVNKISALIILP